MRVSESVADCQMYNRLSPCSALDLLAGSKTRPSMRFGTCLILSDVIFLPVLPLYKERLRSPRAIGGFLIVPDMYHNELHAQVLKVGPGPCPDLFV